MKKIVCFLFCLTMATIFFASSALAIPLGTNITISDMVSATNSSWYTDHEDNEVEPGCQTGQQWDMEAFMLDGYNLSMVGGFNLKGSTGGFSAGDIFIDINNDAKYGRANSGSNPKNYYNSVTSNAFGYEYVLKTDFASETYSVYKLTPGYSTVTVYYSVNDESNPFKYYSGGDLVQGWQGKHLNYQHGNDAWIANGLTGGNHNVATFDLSFLKGVNVLNNSIITHFTLGCGNDNLMGKGTLPTAPVPEPTTLLLLGSGLLGLAGFRKKNK